MKGIILAAGTGSRLYPLTKGLSKHLLPVFSKPMIYYSLSTLMLTGVRHILVVCTSRDISSYKALLGSGSQFGIQFEYAIQDTPNGIAAGILLGEKFAESEPIRVILGDNIFHGSGVGLSLSGNEAAKGAAIFGQRVRNPEEYGVVEFGENLNPINIVEKPKQPPSDVAVTGLYFYDASVFERIRELRPSSRGELEVTDLNMSYLASKGLTLNLLPRGTFWMDTGTTSALASAAEYVKAVETRQGLMIGCPEEVAYKLGYLTISQLWDLARTYGTNDYSKYLLRVGTGA